MKTLEIINNWVSEHSVVLDLGCGKGEILSDLISSKDIKATGVEIDSFNINESIKNEDSDWRMAKGLNQG